MVDNTAHPTPTLASPFFLTPTIKSPTITTFPDPGDAHGSFPGYPGGSGSAAATPNLLQAAIMAQGGFIPESPVIDQTLASPDHRTMESGTRLHRNGSYKRVPEPRFLNDPSPSTLLPLLEEEETKHGEGGELRTGLILRHAMRWAVERGEVELVAWLTGLDGRWAEILDREVEMLEDEEGWGIVGMSVQCSCGRQEKEEGVRSIVGRWGVQVGPRGGRDRTGWTPLHLAALISTPPLISFLLSHGASPQALTNRGLTPLDLVAGMPSRADVALFLEHATSHAQSSTPMTATALIPHFPLIRQKMLERRRRYATRQLEILEGEGRRSRVEEERERWVRERVRAINVEPELVLPQVNKRKREVRDEEVGAMGWDGYDLDLEAEQEEDVDSDNGDDDDDEELRETHINSNMLVFSLSNLPEIFDILITEYKPVADPVSKRALPANTIFLYARFAHYKCDEEWLETLIDGAIERIEQGVYENMENVAHLAFWAYNCVLLLYLLRSDPAVRASCDDMGLLSQFEELVNAIHVFVIRVAERRIDTFLDTSILDYETLEDFNDVRFEGEWSLFRSFVPKKKRDTPKSNSIFANGSPGPGSADISASPSAVSALRTPTRPQSMGDLRMVSTPRSISHESNVSSVGSVAVADDGGPGRITDILSGVLVVLQLYEVNPALIVQIFSQVFYWMSSELFNRLISRKKYLCRSKAVQIRMNITLLDDWVRTNGLPAKIVTKHLAPVTQMLQWLQCLSQIKEFDTLIGTMQTIRRINPLQMRSAVKGYRYEVNEGRMTEECAQYLAQLQKDWEKRRVQDAERRRSSSEWSEGTHGSTASGATGMSEDDSTPVDALFDGTTALADFTPQSAPECLGELQDSRYMLPFALPTDPSYLIATPPTDAAYANLHLPSSPFITDTPTKRPLSRSSFSSSRPMGWALPKKHKLRELPPGFFKWLKEKEVELKLSRDSLRPEKRFVPALNPPLGPSQRVNITINTAGPPSGPNLSTPTPITATSRRRSGGGLLSPICDLDDSPEPAGWQYPFPSKPGAGLPSPGLRSSNSINELREKSKMISRPYGLDEEDEGMPGHVRTESFELKMRSGTGHGMSREGSNDSNSSRRSSAGNYAHAYGYGGTPPLTSPLDSAGVKKRWWKLGRAGSDTPSPTSAENDRRRVRDASEDTIGPGRGWVPGEQTEDAEPGDVRTPEAKTPASAKRFWG
ncbi:hypothetical protein IAT38_005810 [Cryptococcus sp. DSM 104549]